MAQFQKDEVRDRILDAALAMFAERGFGGASVAEIARRAGVATGNVYRYFPEGKAALLSAVVPPAFVADMRALLHRRVHALAGLPDASAPPPEFLAASAELFGFLLEHRLRVVVALGRAEGTPWEGLRDALVEELVGLALAHFRALHPHRKELARPSEPLRAVLAVAYRNLTEATVALLLRFPDGAKLRAALEAYARYHLAGLPALFA